MTQARRSTAQRLSPVTAQLGLRSPVGVHPHFPLSPARQLSEFGPGARTTVFLTHDQISASPLNPRKVVEQEALRMLAVSIYSNTVFGEGGEVLESGIYEPGVVRPGSGASGYECASGERRWAAVGLLIAGLDLQVGDETIHLQVNPAYPIPAYVRALNDEQVIDLATAEALHHEHLSELEEADLFVLLRARGYSTADISLKYGVSTAKVERRLTLGWGLCREGRRLLEQRLISLNHAHIIAVTSGDLQRELVRAAAAGMGIREMRDLVEQGAVLVEHAIFDVAASGLALLPNLFAGDLPDRFADPAAALARQLHALNAQADEHRQAGGWAEVLGVQGRPDVLPEAYEVDAGAGGLVLCYSLSTGQVHRHVGVQLRGETPVLRVVDQSSPASRSRVRAGAVGQQAQAHAQHLRQQQLAEGLLAHPQVALVNVILQSTELSGNVRMEGLSVGQRRTLPGAQEYVRWLTATWGELFLSNLPGGLHLKVAPEVALPVLLGWPTEDLLKLLAFLSCGSAHEEASTPYTAALAEVTGAQGAVEEQYEMSQLLLEDHSRKGLLELIGSMPECLQPVVLPDSGKPSIVGSVLERAARLRRARWVPPYARI